MAIQSSFGRIGTFEDFIRPFEDTDTAIADADGLMFNDTLIIAVSGDVATNTTVDEPNGIIQFSGAGGAGDGVALIQAPMRPDRNSPMWVEARFKQAAPATDGRFFLGFASTVDRDETVAPFSLSGTTLTANNVGECAGFYYDSAATTDDIRFMASSAGTADTTAALDYALSAATTLGSLGIRCNATVTADKYFILRVEMEANGTVKAYAGDETMANKTGLTHIATLRSGTMTTTTMYFPLLFTVAVSTGDPLLEVDYLGSSGSRYWGA